MQDYMETNEKDNVRPFWKNLAAWWKGKTAVEEDIMNATSAYCKATYGINVDVNTLIKIHQHNISGLIKSKAQANGKEDAFNDYRSVYSFPKDISPYIDKILEPFKSNGYKVINLSEKVDEIKDEHVYLISWYRESL